MQSIHQAIFSESESLKMEVNRIGNIANCFKTRISSSKLQTLSFQGGKHINVKISTEQNNRTGITFNSLGRNASYCLRENINIKVSKF
jgi:hypothetical protein